jgi:hypothetical protein
VTSSPHGAVWYAFGPSLTRPLGPMSTPQLQQAIATGQVPDDARLSCGDGWPATVGGIRQWVAKGGAQGALAPAGGVVVERDGHGDPRVVWPWRRGQLRVLVLAVLLTVVVGGQLLLRGLVFGGLALSDIAWTVPVMVLLYVSAALLINRTTLTIAGSDLVVEHGPLPSWRRPSCIPLREIRELHMSGSGQLQRLMADRWHAPPALLLATLDAGDTAAALRALGPAFHRRGLAPLLSESAEQRFAHLLGWIATTATAPSPAAMTRPAMTPPAAPGPLATAPTVTKGITVQRDANSFTMWRHWRSPAGVVVFAIWLVTVILLPLVPMLDGKAYELKHLWGTLAFVLMGYVPCALMFNRSRWQARGVQLSIRHRPFPWWGNRDVSLHDVAQIYSKDVGEYQSPGRQLELLHADGRSEMLWHYNPNLVADAQVVAIERHLEDFLGIVDRPVAGEMQRTDPRGDRGW